MGWAFRCFPSLTSETHWQKRSRMFALLRKKSNLLFGLGLIAPCLIYFCVFFVWPIGNMLYRGIDNPEVSVGMPKTSVAIASWAGDELPPDDVFNALGQDLALDGREMGYKRAAAARRLNYEISSFRALIMESARAASKLDQPPNRQKILEIDERWGEIKYWHAMQRAGRLITPYYMLTAVDLMENDDGSISRVPENRALFIKVLGRTFWMSTVVTLFCVLIAFPVAHGIAMAPAKTRSLLLMLVLLPFWTSLLVRTSAWVILLQPNGLINNALISIGLIEKPLSLIFNRTGVYVAFIHVMLPFVVLPLYSVMVGVSKDYVRAAYSLGASIPRTFLKVYLPMVWPGVWSGGLLCFVVCLGYYITPLLVGGSKDQMISYFIAFFTNRTINWGLAASLAMVLCLSVFILLAIYGWFSRKTLATGR
jgi:putative spermidine/putrescine transport system permease protein|tara:strand:+ start:2715 stop:3983 length:1269 start_codon:yes stop_codon:yes gene_type:complete